MNLEATVKNMLTSLRAVGELQNPAIRERHWDQLMRSTKVTYLVQFQFVYKLKIVYKFKCKYYHVFSVNRTLKIYGLLLWV